MIKREPNIHAPFKKAQNYADFRHNRSLDNTFVRPDEKMPLRKGEDAEIADLDRKDEVGKMRIQSVSSKNVLDNLTDMNYN